MFQVAAARGGYGGERYEKLEFQKKVEQKFKSLQDTAWQVLCLISLRIMYGCVGTACQVYWRCCFHLFDDVRNLPGVAWCDQ